MRRSPIPLLAPLLGVLLASLAPTPVAAQGLHNEAGFATIEPVSFYYHYGSADSRLALVSSEARIFHSFQVAEGDAARKPLFVFFNGGPGSSTSCGLMSMYTSRYTLDNRIDSGGGDHYIENPVPWTRQGNLLYVDARQAGFSYGLLPGVGNGQARFEEFNAQNFGTFIDGADFVRLLLRFLASHPVLRDNPVVIVGESYGGARATVILHILLHYGEYGDGSAMYQDPALAAEIQAHLETVFPEYRGRRVPPEVIARQFGHQVLVQPTLSMGYQQEVAEQMWRQPGSVLYRIGEEVGIPYDPARYPDAFEYVHDVAGRDLYMYTKPKDWLNGFFGNAGRLLRTTRNLSLVTGSDVTGIPELYAARRQDAYRFSDPSLVPDLSQAWSLGPALDVRHFLVPAVREAQRTGAEPGDMQAVFGRLQPWDRYFVGTNYNANWAFHFFNVARLRGYEVVYRLPRFGKMFLENVAFVRTFVSNAAWDLVVYTDAVPSALARHTETLATVRLETTLPEGAARPGHIVLAYRPDAFAGLPPVGTRTIRFPRYERSCHAVSLTQPEDFYADVSAWLAEGDLGGE